MTFDLRSVLVLLLLALGCAVPCLAQSVNPVDHSVSRLRWEQPARADWLSNVVLAAAVAEPCLSDRTKTCAKRLAVTAGVAWGSAMITKSLMKRTRPDGSNRTSFFSGHTALACAGGFTSKREVIGLGLCAGVGYLRIAANKHWLSDVVTGAGVALATSRIVRR